MRYIEIIDTYTEEDGNDHSFFVAVSEDEFELLKSDLHQILNNQEDYDSVYDAMEECIEEHGAQIVEADFSLNW